MSSYSILNCSAELIRSAKKHVYVLVPYWRTTGVDQLKRRVSDVCLANMCVTQITAANMSINDMGGCQYFTQRLTMAGARVCHWASKPLIRNSVQPLMHTKALVVDSQWCLSGAQISTATNFRNPL